MRPNSSRFSRVKWRLILSSVDKWLTKNCIKKIKSLKISDLIKNRVPRTEAAEWKCMQCYGSGFKLWIN